MPIVGTLPLYQIKENQTYGNSNVLNVYYYIQLANPEVVVSTVNTAFQAAFSAARRAISTTTWSSNTFEIWQMNSLSNFGEFSSYGAGTLSDGTTGCAAFIAASIRLLRSSKETRSGWKRYSGLTEGSLLGSALTGSYLTLLQALAAICDNTLSAGGETLTPVIVAKTFNPGPPRVENPPSLWLYNIIGTAVAIDRVTSQNSRKNF